MLFTVFKLFTREVHVNSVIIHLSAVCEITQMVPPAAPGLHECTYKASSPVWFCGEMLSERSSDNKMFILKSLSCIREQEKLLATRGPTMDVGEIRHHA